MTCIINEKTGRKTVEDEINSLLKFYAYDDAIFLAELNFKKENSDESLYLFADCLIRSNKKEECYGLLKTRVEMPPKLRYIFAKCCFDLSKMEDCQNSLFEQESGEIRAELLEDEEVAPHARSLYSALPCFESTTQHIFSRNVTRSSYYWFDTGFRYKLIALIFILLSIYAGVQATKSQMEPIIDKSSCLRASPLATTLYSAGISHLGGFLRDTCESKHSNQSKCHTLRSVIMIVLDVVGHILVPVSEDPILCDLFDDKSALFQNRTMHCEDCFNLLEKAHKKLSKPIRQLNALPEKMLCDDRRSCKKSIHRIFHINSIFDKEEIDDSDIETVCKTILECRTK